MRTLPFQFAGLVALLTVGSTLGAASCSTNGSTTGSGGTSSTTGATTTSGTTTATSGSTTTAASGTTSASTTATGSTTSTTTGSTSASTSASSTGSAMSLCEMTGGTPMMGLCCASQSDYPNTCNVGTCTCAPSGSKMVEKCQCGIGKCYNQMMGCITSPGGG